MPFPVAFGAHFVNIFSLTSSRPISRFWAIQNVERAHTFQAKWDGAGKSFWGSEPLEAALALMYFTSTLKKDSQVHLSIRMGADLDRGRSRLLQQGAQGRDMGAQARNGPVFQLEVKVSSRHDLSAAACPAHGRFQMPPALQQRPVDAERLQIQECSASGFNLHQPRLPCRAGVDWL